MNSPLTVATDGSCLKNPGGAIGWAWASEDGSWMANGWKTGTNQSAELLGLISVLSIFRNTPLLIELDSQYSLNIASKWMHGWARNGWKRKDGEVKNLELVKLLHHFVVARQQNNIHTEFKWVKGHRKDNAHPLNTIADEKAGLASAAARDGLACYFDSKGRTGIPIQDKVLSLVGPHL